MKIEGIRRLPLEVNVRQGQPKTKGENGKMPVAGIERSSAPFDFRGVIRYPPATLFRLPLVVGRAPTGPANPEFTVHRCSFAPVPEGERAGLLQPRLKFRRKRSSECESAWSPFNLIDREDASRLGKLPRHPADPVNATIRAPAHRCFRPQCESPGKLNSTFRTLGPHLSHTGGQLASREPEGSANRINVRFPDFCLSLARFDL